MTHYSQVTAHGRFQPPLHVNHWEYLKTAFDMADNVRLLITNPYVDEAFDPSAPWRSEASKNPFTYEERVQMFTKFFLAIGIDTSRYSIEPFNITNNDSFNVLDPAVPNLVNVYSEWSAGKVEKFKSNGLQVIQLDQPKSVPISGTQIREIIDAHTGLLPELGPKLIAAGFVPEAVPGLLEVLERKRVVK